ncbi:MAG: bifunctional phosphoribosylaminoimidazolecarboxamide formyltransferase/IMP cyclohydrolase [Planctomycetota bacterium]
MSDRVQIRRAIISVYDKTGLAEFVRALIHEFEFQILSTGGTKSTLEQAGIDVMPVERITGFPELLDGRVKTLHPRIHAGILADRNNPEHLRQLQEQGIDPIDMVVIGLYPFEKTATDTACDFSTAMEMIDIGGPCLLRAAAKNHRFVWPVVVDHPDEYARVLEVIRRKDEVGMEVARREFAARAFAITSNYDRAIQGYLSREVPTTVTFGYFKGESPWPNEIGFTGTLDRVLAYGENPHQPAARYRVKVGSAWITPVGEESSPREVSYNNCLDADAAWGLCQELVNADAARQRQACVFVKHNNPCGVGLADQAVEAYRRAYLGDVNAAMGGVLACGFGVDTDFATMVMESFGRWGRERGGGGFFLDVWLAPSFSAEAVAAIRRLKKWGERTRILAVESTGDSGAVTLQIRSVAGGLLVQEPDQFGLDESPWRVVTKRVPTEAEYQDLRLAWLVCKHTKSNAISICKDGMLLGSGAGQTSRVMSCRIARWLAEENGHGGLLAGSAAASDAFFPFDDGPKLLMDVGVSALIQPGGSKRDEEVVSACDSRDVTMIFTGTRHFRH